MPYLSTNFFRVFSLNWHRKIAHIVSVLLLWAVVIPAWFCYQRSQKIVWRGKFSENRAYYFKLTINICWRLTRKFTRHCINRYINALAIGRYVIMMSNSKVGQDKATCVWTTSSIGQVMKLTKTTRLRDYLYQSAVLSAQHVRQEPGRYLSRMKDIQHYPPYNWDVKANNTLFSPVKERLLSPFSINRWELGAVLHTKMKWVGHVTHSSINYNRWTKAVIVWILEAVKHIVGRPPNKYFIHKYFKRKIKCSETA